SGKEAVGIRRRLVGGAYQAGRGVVPAQLVQGQGRVQGERQGYEIPWIPGPVPDPEGRRGAYRQGGFPRHGIGRTVRGKGGAPIAIVHGHAEGERSQRTGGTLQGHIQIDGDGYFHSPETSFRIVRPLQIQPQVGNIVADGERDARGVFGGE